MQRGGGVGEKQVGMEFLYLVALFFNIFHLCGKDIGVWNLSGVSLCFDRRKITFSSGMENASPCRVLIHHPGDTQPPAPGPRWVVANMPGPQSTTPLSVSSSPGVISPISGTNLTSTNSRMLYTRCLFMYVSPNTSSISSTWLIISSNSSSSSLPALSCSSLNVPLLPLLVAK